MTHLRKLRSAALSLLVAVLATTGALVFAELAYRAADDPGPRRGAIVDVNLFHYSPYVVSAMPPNLVLGNSDHVLEPFFRVHQETPCPLADGTLARFNSKGFRSPEFEGVPPKAVDEVRIVITGGSAAMSWNIGEACTLDRLLAAQLSAMFPDKTFRVFNLANAGWQSFQELVALQLYGLDLEPDIVIAFSGMNDFEHAFYSPYRRADSQGHMENAFQHYKQHMTGGPLDFLMNFTVDDAVLELLSPRQVRAETTETTVLRADLPERAKAPRPGALATRVTLPLDLDAIAARRDFDPYNQEVVDFYVRNQRMMHLLVSHRGGHFISVLQPNLYMKTPLTAAETARLESYALDLNFTVQAFLRARGALARISEERTGFYFIDLTDIFHSTDDVRSDLVFWDNVHMYPGQYALISKILSSLASTLITSSSASSLQK